MVIEKIALAAFENAISKEAIINPFANPVFMSAAMKGSKATAKKAKPVAHSIYKDFGKPIGESIKGMGESIGYTVRHPGKVIKSFTPGGNQNIRNKGIVAMSTAGGAGAMATLAVIAKREHNRLEQDEMDKGAAFGMETAKTLYGKGVKFMGDVTGKTLDKAKDTYNRAESAYKGAIFGSTAKKQMSEAAKLDKYKAMADHEIALRKAKNVGTIGAGVAGAAGIGGAIAALARKASKSGAGMIVDQGMKKKLLIGGGAAAGLGGAYALGSMNREQ